MELRRLRYIVLCLVILFVFAGCGDKLQQIRYDVPSGATTLDPQYAREDTAKIVVTNTYEGLMRKTSDGKIVLLGAESYDVSSDGLTYTFNLRDNMKWCDESDVIADDFVFTFERILKPDGDCPYSDIFMNIKNADKVLAGSLSADKLGVKAIGDDTVQFTLKSPDSMFTEKLTQTCAVPTKRSFYNETKGKYGMDEAHILSNGPFKVTVWDNSQYIIIKKDKNYYDSDSIKISGMNIHIGRQEDKLELIKEDKADAFPATYDDVIRADKKYISYQGYNNKIWALFRNPKSQVADIGLTAATIAEEFHSQEITDMLPQNMVKVYRLLPESSKVGDLSYTKNSDVTCKSSPHKQGNEEIRRIRLLVYDNDSIKAIGDYISQVMQRDYSLYADVEYANSTDMYNRVITGDYDIAIMPMEPETSSPSSILYDFVDGGSLQKLGFENMTYPDYIFDEDDSGDSKKAIANYEILEQSIIDSGIVAPLYSETDYFISSNRISGIEFYPYSDLIYIKNAVSK